MTYVFGTDSLGNKEDGTMMKLAQIAVFCWVTVVSSSLHSAETKEIAGKYHINRNPDNVLTITHVADNVYRLVAGDGSWEGIGTFDGKTYIGVWKYRDTVKDKQYLGMWGVHKAKLDAKGSLSVEARNMVQKHDFRLVWIKAD